ncbi:GNAT family N-acetyltransferase [Bacillus atrophaeus]|uniref:GNAT family N-acetyltransferase n=1 Tax=Bacillus atrophaeus TaxID=1452 RepID=UPI00227E3A55|nr:GNAT family N-acetyltransferase [Bacillus atrophaeus]MCY9107907.1 GNAT family N-acetyltransferase [Bacillus atrophaeus]MEC1902634.1 GNAT family N-acetyltransferase [Bacillus atrophaeus]MEC2395945.1 GNAT family N-acetyltransferase [Bacillus atrophaeus]MED4437126.1 GNAT family N-acetyltransferase [Bacillus atrophaeus]MED4564246.1 GNAT family N-acetyltransferase [Bacillus atrophaeus]
MTSFKITETDVDSFHICEAKREDAKEVEALLVRIAEWLREQGSSQWSGLLEGKDTHNMLGSIADGHVFLFKEAEALAGVMMLLPQPSEWDRELWGDQGHEESIYLHRLAVDRHFSGRKLGETILSWAETGVFYPGKSRIRLDCVSENGALNAFYRRMGYQLIERRHSSGFCTYEKVISTS